MENINTASIYLDNEGYKAYIKNIESLKEELTYIDTCISKICLEGRKDDINSEYENLRTQKRRVSELIEKKEKDILKIVIVSKQENSEVLDIGDVVKVKLTFPNGFEDEDIFELTAGENDLFGEITKISVNQPLGKAVYKKIIGETGFYSIREGKVIVTILERVKVKNLSKIN